MKHVFVDSGGFFALLAPSDQFHQHSLSLFNRAHQEGWNLVTTNAVVFETHALLLNRTRNGHRIALRFLEMIFDDVNQVERVRRSDEQQALALIRAHQDKAYSLCDALSSVVTERLGIQAAIAFDRHFRSYGQLTLL